MRAVVQRVSSASVEVDSVIVGTIGAGLLVYLGVAADDENADAKFMAEKIRYLRVFPDDSKPLNRDVVEAAGSVLAVSAFTTLADARKGRRPALIAAADPARAQALYQAACEKLAGLGVNVVTGRFREHMHVASVNDGPICVLLDSKRLF